MPEFASPPESIDPGDCNWYHVMDVPGLGLTPGIWDLRDNFPAYVGNVDLVGKTVLDIGTASGFITFSAERAGAKEVVSFDIDIGDRQTLLPFKDSHYYQDHERWAAGRTKHFQLWKNAYWLAHGAFGSRARVVYGDVYNPPKDLGSFDVVICCAVLEHLADPIKAMAALARHAADRLVLGVWIPHDTEDKIAWFLGDAKKPGADAVFWAYSISVFRNVLDMLGFGIENVVKDDFKLSTGGTSPRTTIVARRRSETAMFDEWRLPVPVPAPVTVRVEPAPAPIIAPRAVQRPDPTPDPKAGQKAGVSMLRDTLKPLAYGLRSVLGTHGLADRLAMLERSLGQPPQAMIEAPAAPAAPPAPAPAPASIDVFALLHQSRGAMLRGIPKGARRLLSAGCAGNWYFEWIEQTYGRVEEHLGIEFYTPAPDQLPDNVTWIANTASNMSGVTDASCDLVISGQNVEHMWPEEVSGFMLEAARVLRPGGRLVMDSPNRLMTARMNFSHPEHTLELTADEAVRLFTMAGFDVTTVRGIWLCRDARDGRMLPFDPNTPDHDWSMTERLVAAYERPHDSFLWWVEGIRNATAPDAAGITALMSSLFREHWPERTQRLAVPASRRVETRDDGEWVVVAPGEDGIVFYGPYMPLRAGRYRCTWTFDADAHAPFAAVDILTGASDIPVVMRHAAAGTTTVSLEFALADTTFGMQFRCVSLGKTGFAVRRGILLEQLD